MSQVRNYEAVLVLKELNGEAKKEASDAIYDSLEKRGAEVLQKENWGVKDIFHPNSKVSRGDFNFLRFNVVGEQLKNIYSELTLDANIIKIFITRVTNG